MGRMCTCENCGLTFESGWTEEEAKAEAVENFGKNVTEDLEQVTLCDDCYTEFMAWWNAKSRHEQRAMQNAAFIEEFGGSLS